MSVAEYTKEPDPYFWEMYLNQCRAEGTHASLSDYDVWLSELEMDRKENYEREYEED